MLILYVIPSIFFYLIINSKRIKKIFRSILFFVVINFLSFMCTIIIRQFYHKAIDNTGYNKVTDTIYFIYQNFYLIFGIILTLFMYIIYKKNSIKMFNIMIFSVRYMTFFFFYKIIAVTSYFNITDKFGYNSIYTSCFIIVNNILTLGILLLGLYYFIKKVIQKSNELPL